MSPFLLDKFKIKLVNIKLNIHSSEFQRNPIMVSCWTNMMLEFCWTKVIHISWTKTTLNYSWMKIIFRLAHQIPTLVSIKPNLWWKHFLLNFFSDKLTYFHFSTLVKKPSFFLNSGVLNKFPPGISVSAGKSL